MLSRVIAEILWAGLLAAGAAFIPSAAAQAQAQAQAAQSIPLLAPGEGRGVARRLAAMVAKDYVEPTIGARYAAMLKANGDAGRYDKGNWKDLCDRLTADLQAVHPDGHIQVNAGPVPGETERAIGAGELVPTEAGQWLAPGIAYLRLNRFSGQADNVAAIRSFLLEQQAAKTLILDLREHRGGRFEEMDALMPLLFARRTALVDLAMAQSVYASEGPMIESASLERIDGPPNLVVRRHFATPDEGDRGLQHARVVLLTSHHTASAGEHFAFALKRTHRATLIGEPTAGADHFGGMVAITDHFNVFLPIGRTYDPVTGEDWEGTGVRPDIAVPATDALATALERSGFASPKAESVAKRVEAELSAPVD